MPIDTKKCILIVLGMKDNFCRERIIRALLRVDGVRTATVSLIRARAVVIYEAPCEPPRLMKAVECEECTAWLDGVSESS